MIYTHMAAGLVVAAMGATAAWSVQSWSYDAQIADIKAAHVQAHNLAAEEATRIFRANTEKYQGALNDARVREAALRRDLAAADSESDGLRAQLSDAARRIAAAPSSAVAEYATTVGGLFADCSRSYQELAGQADGHANDVRKHRDAWPVTPPE